MKKEFFPFEDVIDSNGKPVTPATLKNIGFEKLRGNFAKLPSGWTVKNCPKKQDSFTRLNLLDNCGVLRGYIIRGVEKSGKISSGYAVLFCRIIPKIVAITNAQTRNFYAIDCKSKKNVFLFKCSHPECINCDGDEPNYSAEIACFRKKLEETCIVSEGWDDPTKFWGNSENFIFEKK